jgi:hypothetical protein
MTPFESTANGFLTDVSSAAPLWRSLDVRILAIKINGAWHNMHTRCYLRREAPEQVVRLPLTVSTQRVICVQHVFNVDKLSDILAMVGHGRLRAGELSVHYLDSTRHDEPQEYSASYTFLTGASASRGGAWDRFRSPVRDGWPALYFNATGSAYHELLRDLPGGITSLDAEIHALEGPLECV